MTRSKLIDKILLELSYRTNEGYPDFSKKEHISLLSEILTEWGLSSIKDNLIRNLLGEAEKDKNFGNPILDKEIQYTDANGEKKTGKVGDLLRTAEDTPARKAAEKFMPSDEEERKKVLADLGGEGQPNRDDDKESEDSDDQEQDDAEKEKEIQDTFSDPKLQKRYEDEANAAEELDSKQDERAIFDTNVVKPEIGKISDANDEFSDGEVKQKALDIGFNKTPDFQPAPGNATSMMAEIMSGESFSYLNENPNLTDDELAEKLYDHIKDTTLGKQIGDHTTKSNVRGKYAGKNDKLFKDCEVVAKSGKKKFERTAEGVSTLIGQGKLTEPVKTRNYYGSDVSLQQQVSLISAVKGTIFTREGVEIPKENVIDLIKQAGGGANPSDTSTISIDKKGNALIEFHSDKMTTADIQANSTPSTEFDQAIELINNVENISGQDREYAKKLISDGKEQLKSKELELKTAANDPARKMAEADLDKILADIEKDTGISGKDKVSTKLGKSLFSRNKVHSSIRPYLDTDEDSPSRKDALKAFYKFAGDDNREAELTGDQIKLLYRSAKQQGFDISQSLGKIREESLTMQRGLHDKMNQRSVTLPNGDSKPMGDYIESQNIIDKLHLNVLDGENSKSSGNGVSKYPGLFNVNMGGVIVESKQLKGLLNADNTDGFIKAFEVGTPGDGDEFTKNPETGQITGRNMFVYAVTDSGKKIPFAWKTQRSKQGASGVLNTTYQWTKEAQSYFSKNQ
jgi:hypothetical protein